MNIHEWQMLLVTFVPVSCSVLPVPQDLALLAKGARSYQTCRDEIEQRWKRHRKVQVGADMVHMCMSIQWICRTWSYTSHQQVYAVLPSGEPTYPTWGKGTSCSFIFKGALGKGYVSSQDGNTLITCQVGTMTMNFEPLNHALVEKHFLNGINIYIYTHGVFIERERFLKIHLFFIFTYT